MVALPDEKLLLLEIRDEINRQVSFSALNYETKTFLWKDFAIGDSWWASLLAANRSVLLVQNYTGQDNPDDKSVQALDISSRSLLWKIDNFSFTGFTPGGVLGLIGKNEPVVTELDLFTGAVVNQRKKLDSVENKISDAIRPFQYQEGSSYHATVSSFLTDRYHQHPEGTIEYQEHEGSIFISYYIREENGLSNYLLIMNKEGEKLHLEKIDEQLKGLGVDTFFILSGCLFFVRNKRELLSYQIL